MHPGRWPERIENSGTFTMCCISFSIPLTSMPMLGWIFLHAGGSGFSPSRPSSIMDGPYRKDIVRAVVEAGRKKGLGVGLYYSHVDWHDPAFAWDPFNQYYDPGFTPQSDPERWRTFIDHERQQLKELMTEYGRIDYLDFDIGWPEAAAKD